MKRIIIGLLLGLCGVALADTFTRQYFSDGPAILNNTKNWKVNVMVCADADGNTVPCTSGGGGGGGNVVVTSDTSSSSSTRNTYLSSLVTKVQSILDRLEGDFKAVDPDNGESFGDVTSYLSGTNVHLLDIKALLQTPVSGPDAAGTTLTGIKASIDFTQGQLGSLTSTTGVMLTSMSGYFLGSSNSFNTMNGWLASNQGSLQNLTTSAAEANGHLNAIQTTSAYIPTISGYLQGLYPYLSSSAQVTSDNLPALNTKVQTLAAGTSGDPNHVSGTALLNLQSKMDTANARLQAMTVTLGAGSASVGTVQVGNTVTVTCTNCGGGGSGGSVTQGGPWTVSGSVGVTGSLPSGSSTIGAVGVTHTVNVALTGVTTTSGAIRVTNTDQNWDLGPGPATANTQRVAIANSLTVTVQDRSGTLFSYTNLTNSLNGKIVTNTACVIDSLCVDNTAGNANFLKIYDRTTIPTVATDYPTLRISLQPNNTTYCLPRPLRLNNGFVFLTTQNSAMNDGTSITAGTMNVAGNIRPVTP